MIIVIDGYNLLKQVFPKVKGKLDNQRKHLVKQLGYYKKKKASQIKQVVLVFDGGLLNHATREIHNGVVVIFSGQKSSADEWILDYIQRNKEKQTLLVTLDRELIKEAKKYSVDSISVFDFYKILQNSLLEELSEDFSSNDYNIVKKSKSNDHCYPYSDICKKKLDNKAIELLMEQYSYNIYKKDSDIDEQKQNRKRKSKKLSKKEREFLRKIKKL